jgi:hypothetical protein
MLHLRSLNNNNFTGTIPTGFLFFPKLEILNLANNPLCYSVDYSLWAPTSDHSNTMQLCLNCPNPCLNAGVCLAGVLGSSCLCPLGFSGPQCQVNYGCDPGYAQNSAGICLPCSPGTYSLNGQACVPCQKGTFSNVTASTADCPACPVGSYSSSPGSIACSSCSGSCHLGSLAADASFSPAPEACNVTLVNQDGQVIQEQTSSSTGWVYIVVMVIFMVASFAVLTPLRHKVQMYVTPFSIVVRTPFSFMRVMPSSWTIIEIPSFSRGLVGIWVIVGIILITAYQSQVFAIESVIQTSSVQPGARFTSGRPTSTAAGVVSLNVVLYQSPVSCDTTQFTLQVIATNAASSGALSGVPDCIEDSSLLSANFSYAFPEPLGFTSTSEVSLVITSLSGSPLFAHGVYYKLSLGNYGGTYTQVVETLSNDASNLLTGNVEVLLSAVPTEYLDQNADTTGIGYTFSYFSSSAPGFAIPSSETLKVAFDLPVPGYFYQVKGFQNISGLQFVVGLAALGGGILTVGSLFANAGSFMFRRWKSNRSSNTMLTKRDSSVPISL